MRNFTPGKKTEINYNVLNLENHPVHIYYSKHGFAFEPLTVGEVFKRLNDSPQVIQNAYVIPAGPLWINMSVKDSLTHEDSAKLSDAKCTFYGEFDYKNDLTKKDRTFIFIARIRRWSQNRISVTMYNENADTVFSNK